MPRVPTLLSEVVARPWDRFRLFILGIINSVRALKAHYFRRVTLAGETTFSNINTLARLPGTTHGVLRVTNE